MQISSDIVSLIEELFPNITTDDWDKELGSLGFDSLKLIVLQYKLSEHGLHLNLEELSLESSLNDILIGSEKEGCESSAHNGDEFLLQSNHLSAGQYWFLNESPLNPDSWNDIRIFEVEKSSFSFELFKKSVEKLIAQHTMLRVRFFKPYGLGKKEKYKVEVVDNIQESDYFSRVSADNYEELYHQCIDDAERKIVCSRAPLFNFTFVDMPDGKLYAIFMIHHLISDVYSISLFLKELSSLYARGSQNEHLVAASPDQYPLLMHKVYDYVQGKGFVGDTHYWSRQEWKKIVSIPLSDGKLGGDNRFSTNQEVHFEFDQAKTAELLLLKDKLEANGLLDLLVFAISQSLTGYMKSEYAQLMVIGSGRLALQQLTGIDASKIMGWLALTSVVLVKKVKTELGFIEAFSEFSEFVSEPLKKGYLWDLMKLREEGDRFENHYDIKNDQKVVFNYLGDIDAGMERADFAGNFNEIYNAYGLKEIASNDRSICYRITTYIKNGCFHLRWEYSDSFHSEQDILSLINAFKGVILGLMNEASLVCEDMVER